MSIAQGTERVRADFDPVGNMRTIKVDKDGRVLCGEAR